MDPLASPIHIPIVASSIVLRLVYGGHCVAAILLLANFPLSANTLLAIICIALSLLIQYANDTYLVKHIFAVLLGSDGQWNVVTCEGETLAASIGGRLFVSPCLVILWLKPVARPLVQIVLTPDNTDRQSFRRLRVRLRVPM